ncbi:MAG: hypothetical protein Kow00128_23250 [Deltaproteobacteria bacterium]
MTYLAAPGTGSQRTITWLPARSGEFGIHTGAGSSAKAVVARAVINTPAISAADSFLNPVPDPLPFFLCTTSPPALCEYPHVSISALPPFLM